MPLYEFACIKCGKDFTLRTSITQKDEAQCPSCGTKEVQQKMGGCFISSGNDAAPKNNRRLG